MSLYRLCTDGRAVALALLAVCTLAAGPATAQVAKEDFAVAVANDRVDAVKAMLAKGADPNTVGPDGNPVLVTAAREGNAATVDALLAAGARVDERNRFGDNAMLMAALYGRPEIVQRLRSKGAALDYPGWTPLIYAATGGHDAIVGYLLAQGAKVDAVGPNGTSALMMAIREGKLSTAELLLAKGADVNVRNESGATALAWAVRGNEQTLAEKLRRAGAKE